MKLLKTIINKSLFKSLLIAIISFSVLLGFNNFLPGTIMWYTSIWEYKVKNFDTYKSDFQTIADLAYREFSKGQMKSSYINVEENPDGSVNLNYKKVNSEDLIDVTMSQKERNSLGEIVKNAFHHGDMAYLSLIRVRQNEVAFEIENGHYSLVYTVNGKKPKFKNSPHNFKLKKISAHWYHARVIED
ncbi:hypothetical protein [Cohnella sp. AR92]|uniref:hypothetical protein n=1 Tax=Cohnella sp. AR92 TaxID=648716 RepID=UPI000F8F5078|nr:hypothetical protein [Cohnella sp. AR92]RUS47308.1 hypothetical protein ELR57_09265 [Cohnella sp. AR92]